MRYMLIFLSLFHLASCTTAQLWENTKYYETISHFLTTNDGDELIFIGDKYHYIFSNTDSLNDVLRWKDRALLKAQFNDNFVVSTDNIVTGNYITTCICNNATSNQIKWLKDNGFNNIIEKNKLTTLKHVTYFKEGAIIGRRYLPNDISFDELEKLNNTYRIRVEEEKTLLGIAGRVAETPFTVAGDGVIFLGLAAIMIVTSPLIINANVTSKKHEEE